MTLEEFRKLLSSERPPEDLTPALAALWWDAKGDWTKAHESAQRTKGRQVRGSTGTFIARKATCQKPVIGTAARESLKPVFLSTRNGL